MQYRATVRNIIHHNPIEALLATLDRPTKAPKLRRRSKTPSSRSDEWDQMNEAAASSNDFWLRMVGWPEQKPRPPLDR